MTRMPGPCVRGIGLSPVQQVASGGKVVPAMQRQTGRSPRLLPAAQPRGAGGFAA